MSDSELKLRVQADMKTAMKAREKEKLATIRLILAAIKQKEVDERIEVSDQQVTEILDKMFKQRKESIEQFSKANRQDLVDKEAFEVDVIRSYLPEPLSEQEIAALIEQKIAEVDASSMKDMGKVMGLLKPIMQGRADMSQVSALIKKKLT